MPDVGKHFVAAQMDTVGPAGRSVVVIDEPATIERASELRERFVEAVGQIGNVEVELRCHAVDLSIFQVVVAALNDLNKSGLPARATDPSQVLARMSERCGLETIAFDRGPVHAASQQQERGA